MTYIYKKKTKKKLISLNLQDGHEKYDFPKFESCNKKNKKNTYIHKGDWLMFELSIKIKN